MEAATDALARWHDFYVITGAAAATLTGLQFVSQSLIASSGHRAFTDGDLGGGLDAFGTPTVVHLTNALLVSAVLCVPWSGYTGLGGVLAVLGFAALGYSAVVLRRARRQRSYVPVLEDWAWHVVLPAIAYAAVLLTAVLLGLHAEGALLLVAAATLLLLCIGIHNAWDTFTYLAMRTSRSRRASSPSADRPGEPPEQG